MLNCFGGCDQSWLLLRRDVDGRLDVRQPAREIVEELLRGDAGRRSARSFSSKSEMTVPPRIREVVETCARMLRQSIDAFVRGDAQLARRICPAPIA